MKKYLLLALTMFCVFDWFMMSVGGESVVVNMFSYVYDLLDYHLDKMAGYG